MTPAKTMFLIGTVYVAPHVPPALAAVLAVLAFVIGGIYALIEK